LILGARAHGLVTLAVEPGGVPVFIHKTCQSGLARLRHDLPYASSSAGQGSATLSAILLSSA